MELENAAIDTLMYRSYIEEEKGLMYWSHSYRMKVKE